MTCSRCAGSQSHERDFVPDDNPVQNDGAGTPSIWNAGRFSIRWMVSDDWPMTKTASTHPWHIPPQRIRTWHPSPISSRCRAQCDRLAGRLSGAEQPQVMAPPGDGLSGPFSPIESEAWRNLTRLLVPGASGVMANRSECNSGAVLGFEICATTAKRGPALWAGEASARISPLRCEQPLAVQSSFVRDNIGAASWDHSLRFGSGGGTASSPSSPTVVYGDLSALCL